MQHSSKGDKDDTRQQNDFATIAERAAGLEVRDVQQIGELND